jgi:hypothetical protein
MPDTAHMEYIMSPSPVPQVRLATVATFPKNYFLENLAVRADNSILVTALNHKELWYVPIFHRRRRGCTMVALHLSSSGDGDHRG